LKGKASAEGIKRPGSFFPGRVVCKSSGTAGRKGGSKGKAKRPRDARKTRIGAVVGKRENVSLEPTKERRRTL